jgi:hypothetical protein
MEALRDALRFIREQLNAVTKSTSVTTRDISPDGMDHGARYTRRKKTDHPLPSQPEPSVDRRDP